MANVDLNSNQWLNLVFEGRNKEYGAYEMRVHSGRRHTIATLIVVGVVAAILAAFFIGSAIKNSSKDDEENDDNAIALVNQEAVTEEEELEDDEEEMIEYTPPPEEEEIPKEELTNSVQNTIIDITEDDKVINETKSQDELQQDDRVVGSVNVDDGVDDATKTVVKEEVVVVEEKPKVEEITYDLANVQEKPAFPGGEKAMYEWMNKNLKYPPAAQEDGIEGTVVVEFTIGPDGSVKGAKALRSPHELLSKEAVRMVESMPKWTPGRNNGQPVKVKYTLPVRFKLSK